MAWIDFSALPLWLNIAAFGAGAAIVWFAGTRLARHAAAIAEITGLGSALIGMLLLGGVTSMPEIAVSITAGLSGSAPLAVNNILGGVAFQVAVIAVGDAVLRDQPISSAPPAGTVVFQAIFSALLLCVVAAGVLATDIGMLGVGLWTSAILLTAIGMFWGLSRPRGGAEATERGREAEPEIEGRPTHRLAWEVGVTAVLAVAIIAAGFVLARTSEALAEQTGLGQSFVGAIFTSIATSLPEISTVLGAVWIGRHVMAFSDIFGTNIFDVALLFLVDAVYAGPPVLNEVGAFSAFAAILGIAVTLIYAAGLTSRPSRVAFGLGPDSLAVIAVYLVGAVLLYTLR